MSRTTIVVAAAAALVAWLGAGNAQPPAGITPEMINTTLPEEGAPKAVPGKYAVTSEATFGVAGLRAFRPTDLKNFPKRDTLPVVLWGNGGCAIDSTRYSGFLSTIASHGFLVISTVPKEGDSRRQANADDMKTMIEWVDKENARADSPLKGKIATNRIAAMGQSCGGFMSIRIGADPRVGTIGVFNSGAQNSNPNLPPGLVPTMDTLTKLHGPVLLINGAERDFMTPTSKATFDAIDKLPVFYGARHGAGHTATVFHPGGGEYANVASNWVRWQFKGDKQAAKMFVGKSCSLCTNPNWDTQAKLLK
jgi:dienelactone hydrolase